MSDNNNKEIFTDEFASRLESRAGEKYRPSNGTEGFLFEREFCYQCVYDDYESIGAYCDILFRAVAYSIDHPEYPQEWQYSSNGQPTCTSFEQIEQKEQEQKEA